MTGLVLEARRWSARRWSWTIAVILGAQAAVFLALSRFPSPVPARPPMQTRLVSGSLDPALAELAELRDPTLFALPNPHGFSGAAWLKMPVIQYEMTNQNERPHWLELSQARPASNLPRLVQTNALENLFSSQSPPRFDPQISRTPLRPILALSLRIEDLPGRRMISTNRLPAVPVDGLSSNCVIRVIVNARGETFTSVPLASSGSAEFDRNALLFAKTARFEPIGIDPAVYNFGKLIFEWSLINEPFENSRPPSGGL